MVVCCRVRSFSYCANLHMFMYTYQCYLSLSWCLSLSSFLLISFLYLECLLLSEINCAPRKKNLWQKRWSINMLQNTHKAYTNRCLWTLARLLYAYESIQHRANHDDDNGNSQLVLVYGFVGKWLALDSVSFWIQCDYTIMRIIIYGIAWSLMPKNYDVHLFAGYLVPSSPCLYPNWECEPLNRLPVIVAVIEGN